MSDPKPDPKPEPTEPEAPSNPLIETLGPYRIHRFVSYDQLIADASLENVLINDAVIEQSGLAAFYGALFAKAQRQASMLKLNVSAIEAKVDAEVRRNWPADRKLTEKAVEAEVSDDNRCKMASKAFIAASEIERTLSTGCDAVRHRRDMLEILSRFANEEMRGQMRIQSQDAVRLKAADMKKRMSQIA